MIRDREDLQQAAREFVAPTVPVGTKVIIYRTNKDTSFGNVFKCHGRTTIVKDAAFGDMPTCYHKDDPKRIFNDTAMKSCAWDFSEEYKFLLSLDARVSALEGGKPSETISDETFLALKATVDNATPTKKEKEPDISDIDLEIANGVYENASDDQLRELLVSIAGNNFWVGKAKRETLVKHLVKHGTPNLSETAAT